MSTEKKIEKYLHYYIGCEVEYEGILNGKEMGEELKANKHDVFYIPKIQPVKGKKIGILKSIDVDMEGNYRRARIGRKGLQSHWGKANFKPLLSKLEDMTEEQLRYWWVTLRNNPSEEMDEAVFTTELNGEPCEPHWTLWSKEKSMGCRHGYTIGINNRFEASDFVWFLQQQIDIFGLIEAGLAVDKKTLK